MAPFPSYTKTWHTSTYATTTPTRSELSLASKTVVITGGGAGVGLAIIGRRTSDIVAAKVSIYKLAGDETQVLTISADVSNKSQINEAFAQISKTFGKIDILVPNTGNFTGIRLFGEETVDERDRNLNINVKGVYLVATAFLAHAAENAEIINISTAMIRLPHFGGFSSYNATKIAGANIMVALAKEHPELHVVNVSHRQVNETEMAGKLQGYDHIDDGELLYVRGKQKLTATAELAGDFVVWLASEGAKFLKGKFV